MENKVFRNICLEQYKSRYPGLIPYVGEEPGIKLFPYESGEKDNWGKIVYNIKEDEQFSNLIKIIFGNQVPIKESFINDDGEKIYSFKEMSERYFQYSESVFNGIFLKKVFRSEENYWNRVDVRRNSLKKYTIVTSTDVNDRTSRDLYDSVGINEVISLYENDITEKNSLLNLVGDTNLFRGENPFDFFYFFETIAGIFYVDESVKGDKVPEKMGFEDVDKYISWLERTSGSSDEKILHMRDELGGDNMLLFLKEKKRLLENILPCIKLLNYESPDLFCQVLLLSDISDIGIKTEANVLEEPFSEDSFKNNFFSEEEKKLFNSPDEFITMQGESELMSLKTKGVMYEDNGDGDGELEAILKHNDNTVIEKGDNGEEIIKTIIYEENKSKHYWEYKDLTESILGEIEYKEIPVFSKLENKTSIEENKYFVKYDNGPIYVLSKLPDIRYILHLSESEGDFLIIDGEHKSGWEVVEYTGISVPEDISGNKLFHLKKTVFFEDKRVAFKYGTYIVYNVNAKKWESFILPYTNVYDLTGKYGEKYTRVMVYDKNKPKKDNKPIIYAIGEPYEYVKIDDEYYSVEYITAKPPFNINEFFDTNPKKPEYDEYGRMTTPRKTSYIKNIYSDEINNLISFEYVISGIHPEDISTEEDKKEGIYFLETYRLKPLNKRKITLDGVEIEYYFQEVDFKFNEKDVFKKEWGNMGRKALPSTVSFSGNDVWTGKNYSVLPNYKEEVFNGFTFMNEPEIDVVFNRGNASSFEKYYKLMECNTFEDMKNYGNDFFGIRRESTLK